jgi:hypothetical protein
MKLIERFGRCSPLKAHKVWLLYIYYYYNTTLQQYPNLLSARPVFFCILSKSILQHYPHFCYITPRRSLASCTAHPQKIIRLNVKNLLTIVSHLD